MPHASCVSLRRFNQKAAPFTDEMMSTSSDPSPCPSSYLCTNVNTP
jgi:hypothetical protein